VGQRDDDKWQMVYGEADDSFCNNLPGSLQECYPPAPDDSTTGGATEMDQACACACTLVPT
jgi:hypothetical protein